MTVCKITIFYGKARKLSYTTAILNPNHISKDNTVIVCGHFNCAKPNNYTQLHSQNKRKGSPANVYAGDLLYYSYVKKLFHLILLAFMMMSPL